MEDSRLNTLNPGHLTLNVRAISTRREWRQKVVPAISGWTQLWCIKRYMTYSSSSRSQQHSLILTIGFGSVVIWCRGFSRRRYGWPVSHESAPYLGRFLRTRIVALASMDSVPCLIYVGAMRILPYSTNLQLDMYMSPGSRSRF